MRGLVLSVVLLAAPAARAVDFGLNVGALEVVLLPPAHGGFYPYVGAFVAVPVVGALTFLASLSIEWSFDQQHGGLVLVLTADYQLTSFFGVDLNVALIHDQPGVRFAESQFFLGAGPGVTFFIGKWTLSPFVNFFGGLSTPGASIVPGLNVARSF